MKLSYKVSGICIVLLLLANALFVFPSHAKAAKEGYYYTSGNRILDSEGNEAVWNGLNWFGFETSNFAPHGLWTRKLEDMLDQAKQQGYNLIRLPYSNQMFDKGSQANGIDYYKNPSLKNLTPIEIMDYFIEQAGERGFHIILDRHRPSASGQSELWYTDQYSEQRWIDDWVMLAKRYKGNQIVIGADLHNEPHGAASWGTNDPKTDWRLAAQKAGNAILKQNSDWLIIVEGVESNVKGKQGSYWWGGNLMGVEKYPVKLQVDNRLVYSTHDYGPGVHHQSWFNERSFPNNLPALWDKYWGYISKQKLAPVLVGEFGGRSVDKSSLEGKWQHALVQYIQENQLYWTYWSLNPNSGDTGGLLLDDWNTWHKDKQAMLKPIMKQLAESSPGKSGEKPPGNGSSSSASSGNSSNANDRSSVTGAASKMGQVSCLLERAPLDLQEKLSTEKSGSSAAPPTELQTLQVQAQLNSDESKEQDSSIRIGVQLKNTGAEALALEHITIRYWYTSDTEQQVEQQAYVDYAALGNEAVQAKIVALEKARQQADYYIELSFNELAGQLLPNQSTGEIKLRWNKADWSAFTLSNDYSYAKDFKEYREWKRMTVYSQGKLIYGTEPKMK
ncbi:hypothetical protein J40TS1_04690 [Paenibacillus montaniterrae]|uniref:Endoglucanase n=1 Tax=Paenibacillus montaniterrae TaxID=429341 RepID=A0A920CSH9_9BACL|nr:cellulase family glycosylhydrolase [Paenibacillus montaniterrae]GIP14827.1 hypothetical protein J40TS1_04690 [Paenibacillus montaniterrae]